MALEFLKPYWALVLAALLAVMVTLVLSVRAGLRSSQGRLAASVRVLKRCERQERKAGRGLKRARDRVEKLLRRSESVKPRVLEEARSCLADAEALHQIRHDQVLVAQNQVRGVIVEEFPPRRQDELRDRWLPGAALR